jgi:hypothetical protein
MSLRGHPPAVIPGLSRSLDAVGKHVVSFDDTDGRLFVEVSGVVQRANCPKCKRRSSRVHGRYWRWLSDTPSFGQPVMLAVEVHRSKCINRPCPRQTFSARIDPLAAAGWRDAELLDAPFRCRHCTRRHLLFGRPVGRGLADADGALYCGKFSA